MNRLSEILEEDQIEGGQAPEAPAVGEREPDPGDL